MAWPLCGIDRLADLDRDALVAAGETLGIKPATAVKMIDLVAQDLRREASKLMEEVLQENDRISKERPELRTTLAGEKMAIRAIVHIVIREMTDKVTQP